MTTEPAVQVRDIPLLEEDDLAGVGQHGGHVRREHVLALAHAHDEGHVVAGADQPLRLALVEHRDGVGTLRLAQRDPHRLRDVARVGLLHEVREHLGVRLGVERDGRAPAGSSRSSRKFSMMPLWMTVTLPVQSTWGCALRSFGRPWVAQRVWARPTAAAA